MKNKFFQLFYFSIVIFFIFNSLSFAQVFNWAKPAGGIVNDRGMSISTDANGNSYVTGGFYETATFGTIQLVSNGSHDIFIAKYDANGNCI